MMVVLAVCRSVSDFCEICCVGVLCRCTLTVTVILLVLSYSLGNPNRLAQSSVRVAACGEKATSIRAPWWVDLCTYVLLVRVCDGDAY